MMLIGDWVLLTLAGLVVVPLLVLAVEAFASLLPTPKSNVDSNRPRCAVLVPAHDEESGIATTIRGVRDQVVAGDRIVIVADNCTDDTAAAALAAGVEVIERTDVERRGKGFALEFGLQILAADPPAVVVVVDADCELGPGALDALVRQAAATNCPAQGVYLIGTGREADPRRRLSAFAVLVKNEIRPLGLHRLGLPCLLTGTGMAFPWDVLRKANLGTGNIVEDMKLGADLALAGHAPRLCPEAMLVGAAAPDRRSAIRQRTRWEHGHVHTLITQAPRLVFAGVTRLRPSLVGLGLEVGVPPLSLLFATWTVVLAGCLAWWLWAGGSWVPAGVLCAALLVTGAALSLAWVKFGRRMLPFRTLLASPMYVMWKVPIYLKLLGSREKAWVRTERSSVARL